MIYNAQKVPVFGVILVRISRIRTRITPNTDTFYAVIVGSVTALHVRDSQYKILLWSLEFAISQNFEHGTIAVKK